MRIEMTPHSGVVAYDWLDHAYPVVGWCTYEGAEGGLVVLPMVLQDGAVTALNDARVKYAIVGIATDFWKWLVGEHNHPDPALNYRAEG